MSVQVAVAGHHFIGGLSTDCHSTQDVVMMPLKCHHFITLQLFPIAVDGSAAYTHYCNNSNRLVLQLGLVQMALYAAGDDIAVSGVV